MGEDCAGADLKGKCADVVELVRPLEAAVFSNTFVAKGKHLSSPSRGKPSRQRQLIAKLRAGAR